MAADPYIQLQYLVEAALERADKVIAPAMFLGKLEVDDSDPERPWAYLSVDRGIPKSAYDALQHLGIPCEARFDNPHMTVIKNDEAKALKDQFGPDWKDAVLTGQTEFVFQVVEMVDVDPDGWDEMDRVWFLRCECPGLKARRIALDLTPLPTSEQGEPQEFHITCAVRKAQTVQTESDRTRAFLTESLLGS